MPGFFELNGERYELADFNKLEIRELRELQRISGLNQGRIPLELAEGNVDAWVGMFAISIRRTQPDFDAKSLDGIVLTEVLETIADIEEEREEPPDPPIAPPSERGGNGGASTTPPRIHATVGTHPGFRSSG